MLPAIIDPSTRSRGEIEIYNRLRDDSGTLDWTVLHSLDVSRHDHAVSGELDFLVLAPGLGALALEVKACHRLQRENGLWYYGENPHGDPRGPFKQASEAMHSVRNLIRQHRDLSRIPFWSAVIFPFVRFSEHSSEWHSWQVIDADAFWSNPLEHLLSQILVRARTYLKQQNVRWFDIASEEPTRMQCDVVAQLLRPDFEVARSPSSMRRERQEELKTFTTEQLHALDQMQANARVAFEGPAGTGKTFLAIEAARRSALEGRHVLFLCFNRMLGEWLHSEASRLCPTVTTQTIHSYMLAAAGTEVPEGAPSSYWMHELPLLAAEAILSDDSYRPFDDLVIDEAQDILKNDLLDVLDISLAGGLAAGRWRIFGDFERHAIFNTGSIDLDDFCSTRGGNPTRFQLGVNCRNTPRMVEFIRLIGGLQPGYKGVLRPDSGPDPGITFYSAPEDGCHRLAETLKELYGAGFSGHDIVVLSPKAGTPCAARLDVRPWADRLAPARDAGPGQIPYTTVHAFKGMEAAAVVVTDIEDLSDPGSQSLLYVAVSRATDRCTVLMAERTRPQLVSLVAGASEVLADRVG